MEETGDTSENISAPIESEEIQNKTGETELNNDTAPATATTSLVSVSTMGSNSDTTLPSLPSSKESLLSNFGSKDKTVMPVDFEKQYVECKQLLNAKTEVSKTLTLDNERITKECNELSAKCKESKKKMDLEQEVTAIKYNEIIKEKDELLTQKQQIIDRYSKVGGMNDDSFKTKAKRRTGSNKSIQINLCEYPGCNKSDIDTVRCGACSLYVCEDCNDVSVGKLKNLVKICKTIRFFCKNCCLESESDYKGHNGSNAQNTAAHATVQITTVKHCDSSKCLQEELKDKENVIKSMEKAHDVMKKLVVERNELIENLKTVISNNKDDSELISTKEDLNEARRTIQLKEKELEECHANTIRVGEESKDKIPLKEQLDEMERVKNALLKKIESQNTILLKTELAYDTQKELIESKCENIESLKIIIAQAKTSPSCLGSKGDSVIDLTSQSNWREESEEDGVGKMQNDFDKIPGFQESILCLSNIALHGMVANGLLLWIDVQRRTSTAKEWKENAVKHFTTEEITDAKNMLWDTCDESIIGKLTNRQGTSKEISEINDIERAINSLVEKEVMPLFIATTNMVMRTPQGLAISTQPALKDIEDTMEAVMNKNNAQNDKKHDKVISKSEQGNKRIDDMIKRLDSLEHNIRHGNSHPNPQTTTTYKPNENVTSSNTKNVKFHQRPGATNVYGNSTDTLSQSQQQERIHTSRSWTADDPSRLWNPVGNINPNTRPTSDSSGLWNQAPHPSMVKQNVIPRMNGKTNMQPPVSQKSWAQIVEENNTPNRKPAENASWRKRQQVLVGTADEGNHGGCFSADAELVAHNVAKNITTADLCNWLSLRGLLVKDCTLLTTSEEARSLAFKVTIDPKDFDRATKDAALWPYGVGVRVYKNFNKNTKERENERPRNGVTSREYSDQKYRGYQQRNNQGTNGGEKTFRRHGYNNY